MTLEHTSAITASSSRTSASVDGKGKRFQRHSWSRRSIKWSADHSSKNSRCNGHCAGPIFCCRPGRGSSTRIWTTYSAVGIQNSGRNHKRRSQSGRRLDPRLFGALLIALCNNEVPKTRERLTARTNDIRHVPVIDKETGQPVIDRETGEVKMREVLNRRIAVDTFSVPKSVSMH